MEADHRQGTGMPVLVVEDDAAQLKILSDLFRDEGFEPVGCRTGSEALERVCTRQFPIAVIDLRLPDVSGSELLAQIKARSGHTRLIVHTAFGSLDSAKVAVNLGVFAYVEKVADPSELIAHLHRAAANVLDEQLCVCEYRYQTFFEQAPFCIHEIDPQRWVQHLNPAGERMFGTAVGGQLAWEQFLDIVVPQDRQRLATAVRRAHEGQVCVCEFAAEVAGRRRHFCSTLVPHKLRDGSTAGVLGYTEDITERKLAEQALQETNRNLEQALRELRQTQQQVIEQERLRALGEMASGIAHDLNNALTPVLGYAETLLHDETTTAAQRRRLQFIHTAAMDASRVVERLQEFYRQPTPSEAADTVELGELIRQIPDITRPKWYDEALGAGRTISIELDLQEPLWVRSNAAELREVLVNLVFNAVDAMPDGGHIRLHCRRQGESAVIEVTDTGIGMSRAERQRCFEPFFTTKGLRGSGLGLTVCHSIVRSHGGRIEIESEPGHGTTVRIYLPRCSEPQPVRPPQGQSPLPNWRVLFIDDDHRVRQAMAAMLEGLGLHADLAASGQEGIRMLQQADYDLVITDLGMPQTGGRQVIQEVKRLRPQLPVVLITGWRSPKLEGEPEPAIQPDAVVYKPASISKLEQALRGLMGERAAGSLCPADQPLEPLQ